MRDKDPQTIKIIDHVAPFKESGTAADWERISEYAKELKQVAQHMGMPVVASLQHYSGTAVLFGGSGHEIGVLREFRPARETETPTIWTLPKNYHVPSKVTGTLKVTNLWMHPALKLPYAKRNPSLAVIRIALLFWFPERYTNRKLARMRISDLRRLWKRHCWRLHG